MGPTDDAANTEPSCESRGEIARLKDELRLSRLELARARNELEDVLERQSKFRRANAEAQREASLMTKALAHVLYEQTKERALGSRWQATRARVPKSEWDEVLLLRRSNFLQPVWYLQENHDVAEAGIDPALHFLRKGHGEGRDPGPDFDIKKYVEKHPEVRKTGENPLLHYLRGKGERPPTRGRSEGVS